MKTTATILIRGLLIASVLVAKVGIAAVTQLSDGPLASGTGGTTPVRPNIAFIVDDSGSMDDENMPDNEGTNRSSRCWGWKGYNTLFYNPGQTYKPPFKFGGAVYSDGETRFPDANFTNALFDGYFSGGGYTYGGDSSSNTSKTLATLSNLTPNAVTCSTVGGAGGQGARATLTVTGGNSSTVIGSITVNGITITSAASSGSKDNNTVATNIAAKITQNGYSATVSGNVVTVQAPYSAGNITFTPIVNITSGSKTVSPTAFSAYVAGTAAECPATPSKYYYSTHKTDPNSKTCEANANYFITTDADKIEAPGIPVNGVSGSGRTAAEIAAAKTNYANWYTYYRKRVTLMKAATGEAFKDIPDDKYRIGLFFIDSAESGANGTPKPNNDFKIGVFSGATSGTQRYDWYDKLYAYRSAGYTPLRGALSRIGRMYAGKINGWDPVQYSCQQNFAILSTDGFWNNNWESSTYGPLRIDGTTTVGNVDGAGATGSPATATISIPAFSGAKYYAQSLTVSGLELLNSNQVPNGGTTNNDTFGAAIATSVNQQTAATGYTATYDAGNNRLSLSAPPSAGNVTATPVLTKFLMSGSAVTMTPTAFSGYVAANAGTPLPYKDALDKEDTLADVAYYYYQTDLRTSSLNNCSNVIGSTTYTSLCDNNVLGAGKDDNQQQHMTTFTLGLGVSGTVLYESNYETAPNIVGVTQYYDIVNNTANWPDPIANTGSARIDDLWHAAVNGRGTYYAASNSESLKSGIQSALSGVAARTGSSAAAATSNLEPVSGDNFVYVALYRTVKWDGDLKSFTINPDDGTISAAVNWSAQEELDSKIAAAAAVTAGTDGRTIKYFNSAATNKLKDFTSANLTTDGLISLFAGFCSKTPAPAQCGVDGDDLTATQKGMSDDPDRIIQFLRGSAVNEDETAVAATDRLYRDRDHALGDVVNAVPVYVKTPSFTFDDFDTSYASFKTSVATRGATTYIAANDGMLHAINAVDGSERWAFVPTAVMGNMWRLADRGYADNHRYFADGSPTLADICTTQASTGSQLCLNATSWKTILVAGLNKGGCTYYALDVTDPATPKGLWEFSNPNLGYSYGNPVIAKRADGKWVVFLTSGYNNYPGNGCGSTGDGNGHLFVIDAATGALLEDIQTYTSGTTPAGTTTTPSGLAKINAYIDNASLPIAHRIYGGDMLGNVWRFDFDDRYLPGGKDAVLLATLKDGLNNRQPITTKPELGEVSSGASQYNAVFVGTGKYLGADDRTDVSQQSLYALKDSLTATGIADVRGTSMVSRTLTETTGATGTAVAGRTIRQVSGATMDWGSKSGWYFDFNPGNTSPGERVNVDMQLQFNILTVAANIPEDNACSVGGSAFIYFVDINTGLNLGTSADDLVAVRLSSNALVAGIKTVKLTSGKTVTVITDTSGGINKEDNPTATGGGAATARRTTWRELMD